MKRKVKTAAAVALSAVFTCGLLTGCRQFITTNTTKDFNQVVAVVDITNGEDFKEGEAFHAYSDVIQPSEILKRDLAATFVTSGSSVMQQQGWTYKKTFDEICNSLVDQQIYIQYAIAYLLEHGDAEGNKYTPEGYKAAVENTDDSLAGLKYFLTAEEQAKGLYTTRLMMNNTIDSNERNYYIKTSGSSSTSSSGSARTLPTGVNSSNSDYYDEAYKIYTGFNSASDCGSYETLEGSSVTTRKQAYNYFLGLLRQNDLLLNGEDTTNPEGLSYFLLELKSQYEVTIVNKLTAIFEKTAEEKLSEEYLQGQFDSEFNTQSVDYNANVSSFESGLDSISDTKFILTAPEANYGYVVNILLPFSASQTERLNSLEMDQGDPKGNKFGQRAALLKNIAATDQRVSWITGSTDYSFDATDSASTITKFYGENRTHLFFEDSLVSNYTAEYFAEANDTTKTNYTDEYTPMSKYYGRYSFNGTVQYNEEKNVYTIQKNNVDIDGFLTEMEGYMNFAFNNVFGHDALNPGVKTTNYYTRPYTAYYTQADGTTVDYNKINYGQFIYYTNKVKFADTFDANKMFVAGSEENLAFSVINELSFAYNTDTAGLNPYLGYSVVTGKTSYMTEFEYAAQEACRQGAGSIIVSPTDYGWHIIYCTFSFLENDNHEIKPFTFDYGAVNTKGTFSNLYYEMWKSKFVSEYSENMQAAANIAYDNEACVTVYENRYANFADLDNQQQ